MSVELEAFQALMLEVLAREPDGERALAELREHPSSEPYRAWLDDLEPRMVGVAAALVVRWGVRERGPGIP